MKKKHNITVTPLYTKENPMPLKEAMDKMVPPINIIQFELHKKDGTPCYLPYCTEEHYHYRATYSRQEIVRILE